MFRFILANTSTTSNMKGQLQLEQIEKNTLKEKVLLMAEVLKNCNLPQCVGMIYDPKENKFCALGALGFSAGMPKDELKTQPFVDILGKYLTAKESSTLVSLPIVLDNTPREVPLAQSIYLLNDQGWTFKEIAIFLKDVASEL